MYYDKKYISKSIPFIESPYIRMLAILNFNHPRFAFIAPSNFPLSERVSQFKYNGASHMSRVLFLTPAHSSVQVPDRYDEVYCDNFCD